MNPQFQVEVIVPDTNLNEGTLIVALMQRLDRKYLKDTRSKCNAIGYAIFQVLNHAFCSLYFSLYLTQKMQFIF